MLRNCLEAVQNTEELENVICRKLFNKLQDISKNTEECLRTVKKFLENMKIYQKCSENA